MSISLAFQPVARLNVRLGFPSAVWSYDIDRVLVLLSILWTRPHSLGVLRERISFCMHGGDNLVVELIIRVQLPCSLRTE
jgi:hypothetical protein